MIPGFQMKRERLTNYDYLRVFATFAVVLLHVSALWIDFRGLFKLHSIINIAYIYNDMTRFAVPCFLMLSGALLMRDSLNVSFKQFYWKAFIKLGVPTIIFTLIYTAYTYFAINYGIFPSKGTVFSILLNKLVRGTPLYHMWFMYMILWIYLFVPFVKIIKNNISKYDYTKMGIILCIMATLSSFMSSERCVAWDIGKAFEYLSYFIMGDIIYTFWRDKCPPLQDMNRKGYLYIAAGFIVEIYAGLSAIFKFNNYFRFSTAIFPTGLIGPLTPLATVASILIFIGFTMLKLNEEKVVRIISDNSFNIYLIHALVIELVIRIPIFKLHLFDIFSNFSVAISLPLIAFVLFLIAHLLGMVYEAVYLRIYKKVETMKKSL